MEFTRYNGSYEEALIRLHRSALGGISHGYSQEEEESDIRSIKSYYLDGGGDFLVGFADGKLVAMGGFKIVEDGVAELKRMRIAPELQGRGIGSELLKQLESIARKKNLKKLLLKTAMSRPKTLRFYRNRGYTETGESVYGTQRTMCFEKSLENPPNQWPLRTALAVMPTAEQPARQPAARRRS